MKERKDRVVKPKQKETDRHAATGLASLAALADAPAALEARDKGYELIAASTIRPRPVKWLWQNRLPLGALSLVAGREGIGKSLLLYQLLADVTRGRLDGQFKGQPRNVIVVATEDAWEETIAPRLMAADADLGRVFQMKAIGTDGHETPLTLDVDISKLEGAILESDASLIIFDPLMSRLGAKLDSHKDAEVRLALEPLVALANRTSVAAVGIIHVNKSSGNDPLNAVMGSRAFSAVPRAVLFVATDPDDPETRVVGQVKNNLGSVDQPLLRFAIESYVLKPSKKTGPEPIETGRLNWLPPSFGVSISDVMARSAESSESKTETRDAMEWLRGWLEHKGGRDSLKSIREAGLEAGYQYPALKRARVRAGIVSQNTASFPKTAEWALPVMHVRRQSLDSGTAQSEPS